MIRGDSILVSLVKLVDQLPWPPASDKRPRGCPRQYSDRLMLKALIIMIIRRLYSAYALLRFLEQDDPVVIELRPLLVEQGRFPSRRTWERRLAKLPDTLPGLIGYSGRHLVVLLQPWRHQGRAVSLDSRRWQRQAAFGISNTANSARSHSSIDTEAGWSKSGCMPGYGGSCTWPSPWARCGSRWPPN